MNESAVKDLPQRCVSGVCIFNGTKERAGKAREVESFIPRRGKWISRMEIQYSSSTACAELSGWDPLRHLGLFHACWPRNPIRSVSFAEEGRGPLLQKSFSEHYRNALCEYQIRELLSGGAYALHDLQNGNALHFDELFEWGAPFFHVRWRITQSLASVEFLVQW